MVSEDERAAAELSRINAETRKLAAEAEKLEAEEQRLLRSIVRDAWTCTGHFRGGSGGATIRQQGGLAVGGSMLQRHRTLSSGRKVDRDWWYAVKYGMMIFAALAAAYVVHITLL